MFTSKYKILNFLLSLHILSNFPYMKHGLLIQSLFSLNETIFSLMKVIRVFTFGQFQKKCIKVFSTDPQLVHISLLVIFILNNSEVVPSILWIISCLKPLCVCISCYLKWNVVNAFPVQITVTIAACKDNGWRKGGGGKLCHNPENAY